MLRIASAALMAVVVWASLKLAPVWVFYALACAMILGACWELYRMLEKFGARPFHWLGLAATAAMLWSFTDRAPSFHPCLPLIAIVVLSLVMSIWRREDPPRMLRAAMHTIFPVLFVGLALGYVIMLRTVPGEDGTDLILLVLICPIFADTFAYYVGSSIGRHRLAPRLSPKKSWEGAIGGIVGSVLGALLAHLWFYQRLPLSHAIVIGLVLGAAAILGDLAESLVKRATGVKDSSSLIPGHGGLLDRADSLLFAAPILYYYYMIFLQGR
jgi:phosphatidate cytidylyltransferase